MSHQRDLPADYAYRRTRNEPPGTKAPNNSTTSSLEFKDQCQIAQGGVVPEAEATPIIVGPSMVQVYPYGRRDETNSPASMPTEDPFHSTQHDKHKVSSSFSDKWKWPITVLVALMIVATAATVGAVFGLRGGDGDSMDNSSLRAAPGTNPPQGTPPSTSSPQGTPPSTSPPQGTPSSTSPPQGSPPSQSVKGLFGVTWPGNVVSIDRLTGASTVIGPTGYGSINSAAQDSFGLVFASSRSASNLIQIDPLTGQGTEISVLSGGCTDIRGLAFDSQDVLYALCNENPDKLYTVDIETGVSSNEVAAPRSIQGLDFDENDILYGLSVGNGLYRLDITGLPEIPILNSSVLRGADQALHYDRATGKMLACGSNLVEIDIDNPIATLIGTVGSEISYVRGLFEA